MDRQALRSRLDAVATRTAAGIERRARVDLRALALFRVGLGALLYLDLVLRSQDLVAFYTDYGVLPRRALFSDYSSVYSVYALVGEPWQVGVLFVLAGAAAVALLVGYRTRLATAVSLVMLLSLHERNPMLQYAGDTLLYVLLFWALFLPLGERWALDADRERGRDSVASIASLGLLVQMLLMYAVNAVHKLDSEEWLSGEAVAYVFQADQYTYLLGDYLAGYPPLLEAMTYVWVGLLFASPLLLVLAGLPRALLAAAFAGMHFGMFLTMPISLFPLVAIVGLVPFVQPSVWDRAAALVPVPTRVRRVVARLGRIDPPDPVGAATARVRREAPDGAALDRALGTGRTAFLMVVPYLLLGLIVLSGAADVGYTEVPDPADRALEGIEMDQHWAMFAPDPVSTTRWFAAPATLADGREVDAFYGGPVERDRPADVDASYPSFRWRQYLATMRFADNDNHRSYFANYLCGQWNRTHDTGVETVAVYSAYERVDPYTGERAAAGNATIIEYDCSGEFVQR